MGLFSGDRFTRVRDKDHDWEKNQREKNETVARRTTDADQNIWAGTTDASAPKIDPRVGQATAQTEQNNGRISSGHQAGQALFSNPSAGNIGPSNTPQVGTPQGATMATVRGDAGITGANRALDLSGASRQGQTQNIEQARRLAAGGGTAGQGMFDRGAGKAGELMQMAGAQAGQQFGNAAAAAQGAYGQAGLGQEAATRNAGIRAAQQIQDNSGAALRAQAAMAARSRGGAMGGAALNAMNNQAIAAQAATRQGGQMMDAANRQAADVAASRMLQANQAQTMNDLQTGGALERANINAGMVGSDMMAQGAEMASAEQQAYNEMALGATDAQRGMDLQQAGAATGIGQLGSGIDARLGQNSQFNAGMAHDASRFDAGLQQQTLLANQQNQLANRQLGAGMQQGFTGMGIASDQFGRSMDVDVAKANAGYQSHGMDRAANVYTGQATNAARAKEAEANRSNNNMMGFLGMGAGLAGAAIGSDKLLKKAIKAEDKVAMKMIEALHERMGEKSTKPAAGKKPDLKTLHNEMGATRDELSGALARRPTGGAPVARGGQSPEATARVQQAMVDERLAPLRNEMGATRTELAQAREMGPGAARAPAMVGQNPEATNRVVQLMLEEAKRKKLAEEQGLIAVTSDREAKTSIRPAEKAAQAMLSAQGGDADFRKARAYSYKYKDEADGKGEFVGPMAQDMPAGTTIKRKDGKLSVDTGRVAMLLASAVGEQQKRIDSLERKRG